MNRDKKESVVLNLGPNALAWKLFSKSHNDSGKVEPPNPSLFGSVICACGQPGTGKTYKIVRLSYKAAWKHGLPLIVQDTKGDATIYHRKLIETLSKRSDSTSKRKVEWLQSKRHVRLFNQRETDWFMSVLKRLETKARNASVREAEIIACIEEGGALRSDNENFWDVARGFRNAGVTAYTTVHKDTDITRSARQCLRAVILDRPYEESVEFFGVDIPAMECSPPMSNIVTFIDSFDRTVKRFDMITEWDRVPSVLIDPVQPTNVESITF